MNKKPFYYGYTVVAASTVILVEMFGLNSMGVLLGSMLMSVCIGAALGPVISGILFDAFHNYQLAILISIFVAMVGLMLTFWLTPLERGERKIAFEGKK